MNDVFIIGGSQTDFVRNWQKEGKNVIALLKEVTDDLESSLHRGLYFAGEILDVDGTCGGYNLQWAFSSGNVSGKAAASYITNMRRS